MKITRKAALVLGLGRFVPIVIKQPSRAGAQLLFSVVPPQPPMAPSRRPTAQRNALNVVLSDVSWLQNATRSAPTSATGGYGLLVERFDAVRTHYAASSAH